MKDEIVIKKTPKINIIREGNFESDNDVVKDIIDRFTSVIESKVSRDNLKIFYNNISTLDVRNRKAFWAFVSNMFKDVDVCALYYLDDNMIKILPLNDKSLFGRYYKFGLEEYIICLCHELMHMSSSIVDKENNIIYSGLSQISDENINISVDEAYTEILLYRYFNFNKIYMSYDYQVDITYLIEKIVGKDKMTTCYFNANLYDFVLELQKYSDYKEIISFIENMDNIYVLEDYGIRYKKDIIYYHNLITSFLVNSYINKLNMEFSRGIINKDLYNYKLGEFTNRIHKSFDKLDLNKGKIRKMK